MDIDADKRVAQASKAFNGLRKPVFLDKSLSLTTNPDICQRLAQPGAQRPDLVIGFAAETEKVIEHATAKRQRKGCDWILANDVSAESGTFGGDDNSIHLISADANESWPRMSKRQVAACLAERVATHFESRRA